jgi:hypothetical protein
MNHLHLPIQDSSIQWVGGKKPIDKKKKMAFISKQDYDPPHMDNILDIDGWCPTKQIVTKQVGQNIIMSLFWTNISKVEEQCNDNEDNDISDDGGKAQNDNECHEQ